MEVKKNIEENDTEVIDNCLNISDFFQEDFINYGSYDNTRKIASFIDGFKNAGRKVIYTVMKKNSKSEIKLNFLVSDVSKQCIYIHGPTSLEGVIVNMAQNFVGSNNINLLSPEGSFGSRLIPKASAARYISTKKTKALDNLFNKDDFPILKSQEFEGDKIEPQFLLPVIPIILVNGTIGISSGFAQKILQRKPKDLRRYIVNKLNDNSKQGVRLIPYYEGFNGNITGSGKTWSIHGVATQNKNKVIIEELPIGYNLKSYIEVLDDMEKKELISSYKDKSDSIKDTFLFEVKLKSINKVPNLLQYFKLTTKITENYTSINENNKITYFETVEELFDAYIDIRLEYYEKRRLFQIENMGAEIKLLISKYEFVKGIVKEEIIVNKKTKEEIEVQLDRVLKIIKENDSYQYLLGMPIYNLSVDKIQELSRTIKNKISFLKGLKSTTNKEMWLEELEESGI